MQFLDFQIFLKKIISFGSDTQTILNAIIAVVKGRGLIQTIKSITKIKVSKIKSNTKIKIAEIKSNTEKYTADLEHSIKIKQLENELKTIELNQKSKSSKKRKM